MPPVDPNANPHQHAYPSPAHQPVHSYNSSKHQNRLTIPFILVTVLLVVALVFGSWAFMSRQDYKDKSDAKSQSAVVAAEAALTKTKDAEFAEREKEPLKTYKGPSTFGSLQMQYPKTWSAFITESDKSNSPLDGYLHPDFVPGIQSGTAFAVHFEVTNVPYDQELKRFDGLVKSGKVTTAPTNVPEVPTVAGVRLTGEIETGKQGTMVLFPVRDKTLKISSESTAFAADFDNIILKHLIFVP